ncbi:alpha/beta hydrolase [Pseudomonas sp. SO81]|jgi:pimeloyl-ACP methyl ester carboxylesterase|uniref:alpha/beta fold hydrolase n=1 Tax=Pseudomonas sp. SO81 TaxID=2983246 RepID=UPI0025A49F4B|nr:alpha/beta hydrolase [Pseudomonas sp. SO81]
MLSYFIARGETQDLDRLSRVRLPGSYVALSDGVTHYQLSGPKDGELVLLLPGLTIPLFYWSKFAEQLHRSGYRTLSFSAYGRGYSDRIRSAYTKQLFLKQAKELVEAVSDAEIKHVIATSMGALVAMSLVIDGWINPETLTLVGPAGISSQIPLAVRIARTRWVAELFGKFLGSKGVVDHLNHNVLAEEHAVELKKMVGEAFKHKGSMYSLLSTLRNFPLYGQQELFWRAGDLELPKLLLWGAEDQVTPVSGMPIVKSLLRPRESHIIHDCGHMAPFEHPEIVSSLFIDFVQNLKTKPAS